jgi:tRNA A-37 threonylcarbamoyl transferase component Bud32
MKKLLTKGIRVPKLLEINEEKHLLEMEYISGLKLKDSINNPAISEE